MIDQDTLKRDARANISDWPATIKHRGRKIIVQCSADADSLAVSASGLLDDMSLTFVGIVDDFGERRPQTLDEIDLQMANGRWLKLEVKSTPDYYDPLGPTIQFTAGSPDK